MEGYDDIIPIPGCYLPQVDEAILQAVAQGLIWMTNGPASILGETDPRWDTCPVSRIETPARTDCGERVDGPGNSGCMEG